MEKYISIIAIVISFISALAAWRSNVISKKALKISALDYENRKPKFSCYLKHAIRIETSIKEEKSKIILAYVTASNQSDFANTLRANLIIKYKREGNKSSEIMIEHMPELSKYLENSEYDFFEENIDLNPRGSQSKWLLFKYPSFLSKNHRISEYLIELRDNFSNNSSANLLIIHDVI